MDLGVVSAGIQVLAAQLGDRFPFRKQRGDDDTFHQ